MERIDRLNPEPTDVQLATFRRHKAAGTTPGNPKWYKPDVVKPFEFKAGLPPKYPHLPTGAQWLAKNNPNRACRGRPLVTRYMGGTSTIREF